MYTENDMIQHYKNEAEKFKDSNKSTMQDEFIRENELKLILQFTQNKFEKILDLGCGNGVALDFISKLNTRSNLYGIDFNTELIEIAKNRNIKNCIINQGDARKLNFEDNFFDKVYTERCLINILDKEEQEKALLEIYRILKPGGEFLMIECFSDGFDNNNKARKECGLDILKKRDHNLYFEKESFFNFILKYFKIIENEKFPFNFFSSHYFFARVLHPLITKGDNIQNTEFVKFFDLAINFPVGNYSPIQVFLFKK